MDSAGLPPIDEGSKPVRTVFAMLGPLPRLYRQFVVAAILMVGIAGGAWIAYVSALPLAATVGAGCGAAVAVLIAYLMVHDFSHRAGSPRVVRRR